MATRREQRKDVKLTVRVYGTDSAGSIFSESVSTVNVSLEGAMLKGFYRHIQPGEIIGLTYGTKKARFRVQWVGEAGTDQAGCIGVHNVVPNSCLWDIPLPQRGLDDHGQVYASPRQSPRLKCSSSVELKPTGQPPMWSKVGDLSQGGCFVEMMIPLHQGTRLKISLWLKENKVLAEGVVVHSRPGFGVGIRFTEMSQSDSQRLQEFLKSMVRIPVTANR
jgi:PilZ domain-containing protein